MELELLPTELVIAHPESERETRYQIAGILGEGGSGTTYLAQLVGTERFVALKQLSLVRMDDWKAIDLHGIYVGSREMFETMNRAMALHHIQPVIDRVFPFVEAPDAYHYLQSGSHFGKVVIQL